MVITLALISLAAIAPPAEPQAPPSGQSPAYTLSGVRRAATVAEKPAEEQAPAAPHPSGPLARAAAPQQPLTVETWTPRPIVTFPRDDRFVTASLAPMGSGWHQEFLGMTEPVYGSSPFDMMGNRERVQAVATSMAFGMASGLAIDGVGRLVKHFRKAHREGKVNKVRREIDAETAVVEQRYKASLAGQAGTTEGAAGPAIKKPPR